MDYYIIHYETKRRYIWKRSDTDKKKYDFKTKLTLRDYDIENIMTNILNMQR